MQDKYNIAKSTETQENSTANIKVTMSDKYNTQVKRGQHNTL